MHGLSSVAKSSLTQLDMHPGEHFFTDFADASFTQAHLHTQLMVSSSYFTHAQVPENVGVFQFSKLI